MLVVGEVSDIYFVSMALVVLLPLLVVDDRKVLYTFSEPGVGFCDVVEVG